MYSTHFLFLPHFRHLFYLYKSLVAVDCLYTYLLLMIACVPLCSFDPPSEHTDLLWALALSWFVFRQYFACIDAALFFALLVFRSHNTTISADVVTAPVFHRFFLFHGFSGSEKALGERRSKEGSHRRLSNNGSGRGNLLVLLVLARTVYDGDRVDAAKERQLERFIKERNI